MHKKEKKLKTSTDEWRWYAYDVPEIDKMWRERVKSARE